MLTSSRWSGNTDNSLCEKRKGQREDIYNDEGICFRKLCGACENSAYHEDRQNGER